MGEDHVGLWQVQAYLPWVERLQDVEDLDQGASCTGWWKRGQPKLAVPAFEHGALERYRDLGQINAGQEALARGHIFDNALGDLALVHRWRIEPGPDSGKRVMVVGAGPAGLSSAYHLRRMGHAVTIFDASPKPGGMIRYGIPKYRMPREKLTAEIARIEEMGVDIQCNTRIDDVARAKSEGGFDAVFLGIGAQLARTVEIPTSGDMPVPWK